MNRFTRPVTRLLEPAIAAALDTGSRCASRESRLDADTGVEGNRRSPPGDPRRLHRRDADTVYSEVHEDLHSVYLMVNPGVTVTQLAQYLGQLNAAVYPACGVSPSQMVLMLVNNSQEINPKDVINELTTTQSPAGNLSSLGLIES